MEVTREEAERFLSECEKRVFPRRRISSSQDLMGPSTLDYLRAVVRALDGESAFLCACGHVHGQHRCPEALVPCDAKDCGCVAFVPRPRPAMSEEMREAIKDLLNYLCNNGHSASVTSHCDLCESIAKVRVVAAREGIELC